MHHDDSMKLRFLVGLLGVVGLLGFSQLVFADDAAITRRDAFIALWQGIKRPATESRGNWYADMPATERGALEINYAKRRQILEDEENFRPNDPLLLRDALLWMLRTRNVADPDDITEETLQTYLEKYPLGTFLKRGSDGQFHVEKKELTEAEFSALVLKFDQMLRDEVHEASLYGEDFQGKGTAFGESFDMNALTAAHRTFPYNTLVTVTNIANNKSVTVRINDRGPYVKGRDLDLSVAAFTTIADRSLGKIHVRMQRLGDVTLVGPCANLGNDQRRIFRKTVLARGVPQALELGSTMTLTAKVPFVVLDERFPDGEGTFVQDWVLPGETFTFKPSIEGVYRFLLGTREGQQKWMTMQVAKCG
jgi:rare lipoprotein A (peptidoglycan hydrolase)